MNATKAVGLLQQQGEAAYKKHAKDASSDNRRFALEDDYTDFKNSKNFRPLVPEEAATPNGVPAAPISTEGLHTAQEPKKEPALASADRVPILVAGVALLGGIGLAALSQVERA